MKSKLLLRIAFGVMIFHLLGHSVGHFTWKQTEDDKLAAIIQRMDQHDYNFMGASQTIGGHHQGFSWLFEITLITFAVLTWILSSNSGNNSALRSILLVVAIALICSGIVELIYFFPLAGGSSLLAGILQLVAWFKFDRQQSA